MKKENIVNLIRYHYEENEKRFKEESFEVAKNFDKMGDTQLAHYVMSFIASADSLIPQSFQEETPFGFRELDTLGSALPLPESIISDVKGILNAIGHNIGMNKFLFEGAPGTGKTETVKHLARLLERRLFMVNISELVDSKLGQTSKNISRVFNEMNIISFPEKYLFLIDEIDAIALDRINVNDIREMGRVTSSFLSALDDLSNDIVLIATTNLFSEIDKALIRRFDSTISFDKYTQEDLLEIAVIILKEQLNNFPNAKRDINLFKKIVSSSKVLPNPGDLKNIIRTSLAFSDLDDDYDYMKRLYKTLRDVDVIEIEGLYKEKFTLREIESLSNVSKSTLSRRLRNNNE